MYDRAPRLLRLAEGGSTEEHVGPGSYQVPVLRQQATGGYAPFLSLATRESTFTVASNTEKAVPGPGHYNVSEAQKISRAPPPVSRSVDVPSIPSCGRSYGYDINEDGGIIKHFPPASDSTLGPAYYKPQLDFSSATLKYKGIHFGNSLGRLELPIKSGPGPGQYDIGQKKTPHYENINIKKDQQLNYCLNLPRFYEVIILQEEKKGVPGPGKYDIKSQFRKAESIPSVNDASPAFLSQSQRFVPMKSITPAPGTYNESRTAFNSLKKAPGLKSTPFGQSAARFTQDCRTEEMPGPGFYNILNNTIIDKVSNTCLKKQKKSAFGSSVPRTLFLVQKEACSSPGPADYQVRISDELPDLTNYYTAFLSRTQKSTKLSDMDNPAPGSYNVQKSYEMSQVQHKYMAPRSFVAKLKHASFLSTTPRCLEKMTDGPGPATYDPVLKKSCSIPLFVKASKRFKDSKEITPGPATYEVLWKFALEILNLEEKLSPFLRHSVLKRTFNVTLPNTSLITRENTFPIDQKAKQKYSGSKVKSSKW
ncbi:sperm-tail PG-rich repeat-containing protein 2 isoform X11 [Canis lupus dingo]|uniref:sperm-tail PG-rich repeat-containing protein 2 isoform X11 n=1 Tax=Canis lupus dingo TaxID=286419 RepID=UPI000BAA1B4D|nr:sperm-tail PG-rich repeat-containing protein 2 isoform X11 [Canis lupus dingo]|eukprot:XP_022269181.1 sperm-tail PG-rich repeat-containing protein 2 isoform X6 [Canis lupus familiaris]